MRCHARFPTRKSVSEVSSRCPSPALDGSAGKLKDGCADAVTSARPSAGEAAGGNAVTAAAVEAEGVLELLVLGRDGSDDHMCIASGVLAAAIQASAAELTQA